MKIAQVVITKTKSGKWKITAMSLNKTETCDVYEEDMRLLNRLDELIGMPYEWERLSLDV